MDFSLLQPQARRPFLRDITALKPWVYYVIMVIDPVLRFSWIPYAIFTHHTQHSNIVSFATSLAEVVRRGLWAIIRVENEHCANVAQYKASRDTPLPYELKQPCQPSTLSGIPEATTPPGEEGLEMPPFATTGSPQSGRSTGIDASPALARTATGAIGITASPGKRTDEGSHAGSPGAGPTSAANTFRRRYTEMIGKKSILRVMAEAHKQDFEKKRPPPEEARARSVPDDEDSGELKSEEEEEDDDEDEDSGSLQEERMQAREAETLMSRGKNSDDEDDGPCV